MLAGVLPLQLIPIEKVPLVTFSRNIAPPVMPLTWQPSLLCLVSDIAQVSPTLACEPTTVHYVPQKISSLIPQSWELRMAQTEGLQRHLITPKKDLLDKKVTDFMPDGEAT